MTRAFLGNAAVIALLVLITLSFYLWQHRPWGLVNPLPQHWLWAALASGLYALWCAGLWWRRRPRPLPAPRPDQERWIIAWASQTGNAIELANATAQQVLASGRQAMTLPVEQLTLPLLQQASHALFVVATTGEGAPPDHALPFFRACVAKTVSLPGMKSAVLALGDRDYSQFCAVGQQLAQWLSQCDSPQLFPRVDVDDGDVKAIRRWHTAIAHALDTMTDISQLPQTGRSTSWRLQQRAQLNPGSQGGPVYHLQLVPADAPLPAWEAGDIALITPQHSPERVAQWMAVFALDGSQRLADGRTLAEQLATVELPPALPAGDPREWALTLPALKPREYSIASMPSDGHLALLLRRFTGPDGNPGLGSGWLCDVLQPGCTTQIRLRSNPGFHPPGKDTPLVLIGNGTGIAGLRAQLRARIDNGAYRNWLLFGERSRACDFHFSAELQRWQADGQLEKLDTTFSRDGGQHRHVQHALAAQADMLKRWLEQGAVVMVCGSLKGMAPDVDAVITQALGQDGRDQLLADGRYRRDVY